MADVALLEDVRRLRYEGRSPKEIARSLGVPPALVAPLVRKIALDAPAKITEPALVGCWVNQGWSEDLEVSGHLEWPRGASASGCAGLCSVVVAREAGGGKVSVCCIVVDTGCLGVKNAIPPRTMRRDKLAHFKLAAFGGYDLPPLEVPLDLVQDLVFGAVEYARGLGFEPHPDLEPCLGHLGSWSGPSAIQFGRDGQPMYVSGPYDDVDQVMATLDASVGEGNFHFLVGLRG